MSRSYLTCSIGSKNTFSAPGSRQGTPALKTTPVVPGGYPHERPCLQSFARGNRGTIREHRALLADMEDPAGFLRLLTNKHVMQEQVMRPQRGKRIASCEGTERIGYFARAERAPKHSSRSKRARLSSPNLRTNASFAHAARSTVGDVRRERPNGKL